RYHDQASGYVETSLFYKLGRWGSVYKFDVEYSDNLNSSCLYPKSDRFFSLVASWLQICCETHVECGVHYDVHFKPTRLIDVGARRKSPRLIETKNHILKDSRYLALSHCWGDSMPESARTISSNLSKHIKEIPLRTMPRTFQDAIISTRRLGLQYLWIDSLCILQDSPNDWEVESSLMGKVYSHCFCMLAAAAAKNCHEGLFPILSELPLLGNDRAQNIPDDPFVLIKPDYPGWDQLFDRSLLNERGWTLQERELSPRVLYFNKQTILFECKEARGGERGESLDASPWSHSRASNQVLFSKLLLHTYSSTIAARALDPVAEGEMDGTAFHSTIQKRYKAWREMVQGYSKRELSVVSDKLPALSGLASEFSSLLNDQYIAGLWKGDIIAGLCWNCEFKGRNYYGRQADYGPSWSWAEMIAPVTYENLHQYVLYRNDSTRQVVERTTKARVLSTEPGWIDPTLLDYSVEPEGKDPNGTLLSAYLFFQGQIRSMERLKIGSCMIGEDTLEVIWDFLPQSSNQFHLLSLGRIRIGLVLAQDHTEERTYRRVGIVPMTKWSWFAGVQFENLTLV
ncbi:hypothetical protein LSUE1_G004391, partial [Lachnellula suecica]